MVFTIPTGMRQTLIVSHRFFPLYFWSSKEDTPTVVTVKPMRVTPAELGGYQCLIKG